MEKLNTEIDPGQAVLSRAQELGLVAEHIVQYDKRKSITHWQDPNILRSRVVCAPPDGEIVFDPAKLQNILESILPTDEEILRREYEVSRFVRTGVLILPFQNISRKIGTCSLSSNIEIEGQEPTTVLKSHDLTAETGVLISPSARYIPHLHMSGHAYRNFLSKDELKVFKKEAKRELSLWERIQ